MSNIKRLVKGVLKSPIFRKVYFGCIRIHEKLKSQLDEQYTKDVKRKVKGFGIGSRINGKITIFFPKSVFIGNNVHVGGGAFLDGRGGIVIGDNTHISRNLTLYTSNHNYEGEVLPYDYKYVAKEVVIGKNVWIGMNVCITPGVHIGDGAIIGMGSVISKNVNAGEIVVSANQRVIGNRNVDHYNKLEENNCLGGISGHIVSDREKREYLLSPIEVEEVVFVLSTGRSGSTTMAKIFEGDKRVAAFHETFHFMIGRLSVEYQTGKLSRGEAKDKLYAIFNTTRIVKSGKIYLESDQVLAPFIPILNEIFVKPKFIWIIRDPKTFMHSATSRGWFLEESPLFFKKNVLVDPQKGVYRTRISGELIGDYTKEEWDRMDQRHKVLWYWKYWNNTIENELQAIPKEQQLFVKMENLKNEYNRILKFLGIESLIDKKIKKTNKVKKKDIEKYRLEIEENYKFFEQEGIKMVKEDMKKFNY